MGSSYRKIQKNAQKFEMDKLYQNMTPEQYKEGIRRAVKIAVENLGKEYDVQMEKMREEYNRSIREGVMLAMDTLSVEILYELGNILECYKDEPEYLDQKIDIVQGLYEKAMQSINDYAGSKYKNDNQAHRVFAKKKKIVKDVFGIYSDKKDK